MLRRPEEYTVEEILKITEGTLAAVACLDEDAKSCPRAENCKTLPMWKKYNSMVHAFFRNITLADLVNGNI